MGILKRYWKYLIGEPFAWLFYCFAQPKRFNQKLDIVGNINIKNFIHLPRLFLPTFIISFVIHLTIVSATVSIASSSTQLGSIAATTFLGMLSGILLGAMGGLAGSITLGIIGGAAGDIPLGITVGFTTFARFGLTAILILGAISFILFFQINTLVDATSKPIAPPVKKRANIFLYLSSVFKELGSNLRNMLPGSSKQKRGKRSNFWTAFSIVVAITLAALVATLIPEKSSATNILIEDMISGALLGLTMEVGSGIILGLALLVCRTLLSTFFSGIETLLVFEALFIFGYSRLLIYPFSLLSTLLAYRRSNANRSQVFTYLQQSALYWDERAILPLPGLKDMLLLAANQNVDQTIQVLIFIKDERPQQIRAAWTAMLAIVFHELEKPDTLQNIAKATIHVSRYLSRGAAPGWSGEEELSLIDPEWEEQLNALVEAGQEARRHGETLYRLQRQRTLADMLAALNEVKPNPTSRDTTYNEQLRELVHKWRRIAEEEQIKLARSPEEIGLIDNPYKPGPVLVEGDPLFVGRQDVIQRIEQTLNNTDSTMFFLIGERRMGKTSILRQLPARLGPHFIPIEFTLQRGGMIHSIDALLSAIAAKIIEAMRTRKIAVVEIDPYALKNARQENEPTVYATFNEWLKKVVDSLAQSNHSLLLMFDEFDRFEEAADAKYFDVSLFIEEFRGYVENHQHIAVLYSGVAIKREWAGQFAQVQEIQLSSLDSRDARQLITLLNTTYRGQEVFSSPVAKKITEVTGGSPFLIQAVCFELILYLNMQDRQQAEIEDIDIAVDQVLDSWRNGYFQDLWNRTDENGQHCLIALYELNKDKLPATVSQLAQRVSMSSRDLRAALDRLCKRKLVQVKKGTYQINAPIFAKAIEMIANLSI